MRASREGNQSKTEAARLSDDLHESPDFEVTLSDSRKKMLLEQQALVPGSGAYYNVSTAGLWDTEGSPLVCKKEYLTSCLGMLT